MLLLALDTSSAMTTVAVADEGALVDEQSELAPNRHAEVLAPLIERALRRAGADRRDIGMVAVGVGPGPFTGLRVGIVTALGLADALGVGVHGVCSLDAIAHVEERPWADGFAVVTDARRREVYWATYLDGERTTGPTVDRPDVVTAQLGSTTVVGAGAELYPDAFAAQTIDARWPYPGAGAIARLALDPRWRVAPQPMYLRRPDARPPGPPKRVTPA